MSRLEGQRAVVAAKFEVILPHLDERQRRMLTGAEAPSLGHGGIRVVARAAGVREATLSVGARGLVSGQASLGRIRRPGAGRKRVVDRNPAVREALLTLVKPDVRGDPMSVLGRPPALRVVDARRLGQPHDAVGADPADPFDGQDLAPGSSTATKE